MSRRSQLNARKKANNGAIRSKSNIRTHHRQHLNLVRVPVTGTDGVRRVLHVTAREAKALAKNGQL